MKQKIFTLTKLSVEEGQHSSVHEGHSTSGSNLIQFNWRDPDSKNTIDNVSQIVAGRQILLMQGIGSFHRTSEISKILSRSDDEVVFKTQTSVYKLTQRDED